MDQHLSDDQLLQDLDGELSAHDAKLAAAHLAECWRCRARRRELESAIADFLHAHDRPLPPGEGPAALLRARMAQRRAEHPQRLSWWISAAAAAMACVALFAVISRFELGHQAHRAVVVSVPDPRLTPGATIRIGRRAVCSEIRINNKAVSPAVQRKVFEAYGILGAEPAEYEVDYLITPALGGADDIRNLWPQSHTSTVWNAETKDALEDRLREMVCDGSLDLTEAQQEIAANWIEAYKKYFHTEMPVSAEHRR